MEVVPSPKSIVREIMPPLGSVLAEESAVTSKGTVPVCGVTVNWAVGGDALVVDPKNSAISGAVAAPPSPLKLAPTSSAMTLKVLSWE